ncbi:MAG: Kelch repeat-containing protein [Candidatus Hodarchaeales archaeon]|jgi:N-acetylneuraminic acid mutarotase
MYKKILILNLFILVVLVNSQSILCDQSDDQDSLYSSLQTTSDWVEMSPAIAPPARYHHWGQTAYDSQSDRVILFSGDNGNYQKIFNDTWAYDYNTDTWENLTTPEMKNIARFGASMAYDSESDRIIMFGGWKWKPYQTVAQSTGVGETWSYDYETNTWTNLTTEDSPPFRGSASMSYDGKNDRMILFGGFNSKMYETPETTIPFYCDTWAYDYNTNTWTNMSPSANPPPIGNHESVYDSESNKTIIFGGRSCRQCPSFAENWAYDYIENTWTDLNPVIHPSPRLLGMMTYIPTIDLIVFYGGIYFDGNSLADQPYSDTWTYDYNTNTWENMNSPSPPSPRFSHSLDYDSESDVSILFGGKSEDVNGLTFVPDDTWAYHYQANFPSAPRNLQASLSDGEVSLSWETPSTEAGSSISEYLVYRGSEEDSLELYSSGLGNETLEFVDTELNNGPVYFYAVRAKNAVGESKNSNVVDINIPGKASGFSLLILSLSLFTYIVFKRR